MRSWISVVVMVFAILVAGLAAAQEIPPPVWEPTRSGMPEPMSLTVQNVAHPLDGSAVEIPFTIDQPATIYCAVYSVGANPDPVPLIMAPEAYYDGEKWVGTANGVARGADTHIDTLIWRTPDNGVYFEAGSHTIAWPGTNMDGEPVAPGGTYAYYLMSWNGDNATTVGRSANGAWMDWRIDWSADPPAVWSIFGSESTARLRFTRSFIGTDYSASPNAYDIYDATGIMNAVNAAGGEPDARLWACGVALGSEENVFYTTLLDGPASGVHKLRVKDDGTLEPVAEFGENGHVWLPFRVYDVVTYDGYVWVASYNREDIVAEAVKLDPVTGERVGAVDFSDVYTGVTVDEETGEETQWCRGPTSIDLNERGVITVTHSGIPGYLCFADYDSKLLWVNDNGDGWYERISWDHDSNPDTKDVGVEGNENAYDVKFVGPYGFASIGSQNGDARVAGILGPDGNGLAKLEIPGAMTAASGNTGYHEDGGPYDGWYTGMGSELISDEATIAANEWPFESEPSWLVYVPGRIRRGFVGDLSAGVREVEAPAPNVYALGQNVPNPFNPSTTIQFCLPEASRVVLSVYNLTGQEVVKLANQEAAAGTYSVAWDGRDTSGQLVSSGVYIYRLTAGDYAATKRMIQLK